MKFQKGHAKLGGRKPGTPNKRVSIYRALVDKQDVALVRAVIARALDGDMTAAKLLFDRIWPAKGAEPATFTLPAIETPSDLLAAQRALIEAASRGEIGLDTAEKAAALLAGLGAAFETVEMSEEIEALREAATAMQEAQEGWRQ